MGLFEESNYDLGNCNKQMNKLRMRIFSNVKELQIKYEIKVVIESNTSSQSRRVSAKLLKNLLYDLFMSVPPQCEVIYKDSYFTQIEKAHFLLL